MARQGQSTSGSRGVRKGKGALGLGPGILGRLCPLTFLAVDAGCLPEISAGGVGLNLHMAPLYGLGFLMVAGFQGQMSCVRETKNSREKKKNWILFQIQPWKSSSVVLTVLYQLDQSQSSCGFKGKATDSTSWGSVAIFQKSKGEQIELQGHFWREIYK